MLLNLRPKICDTVEDAFCWGSSSDGMFSTKFAYESIVLTGVGGSSRVFKLLWHWPRPERIHALFWKAARGVLMTNVERQRRHFSESNVCSICGNASESLFHCFRDCPRVSFLWQQLRPPNVPICPGGRVGWSVIWLFRQFRIRTNNNIGPWFRFFL